MYLSGGATNPFVSLYLLQVVLGAVLLDALELGAGGADQHRLCRAGRRPPPAAAPLRYSSLAGPFVFALWFNYTLIATLVVQFVTRIARTCATETLAWPSPPAGAEEKHIVRMGLLASGAAHELGTPLASISVALGDWRADAKIRRDPQLAEVADMQAEVARCKAIVAGILFAAGEVSGEAPERSAASSPS